MKLFLITNMVLFMGFFFYSIIISDYVLMLGPVVGYYVTWMMLLEYEDNHYEESKKK